MGVWLFGLFFVDFFFFFYVIFLFFQQNVHIVRQSVCTSSVLARCPPHLLRGITSVAVLLVTPTFCSGHHREDHFLEKVRAGKPESSTSLSVNDHHWLMTSTMPVFPSYSWCPVHSLFSPAFDILHETCYKRLFRVMTTLTLLMCGSCLKRDALGDNSKISVKTGAVQ